MDKETVALAERAIKTLADIAEKHGPAALDLALATIRWQAAANLASAGAVFLICVLIARRCYKFLASEPTADDNGLKIVASGISGVLAAAAAVFSAFALVLNTGLWLAVIDPRMALAARVLGLGK